MALSSSDTGGVLAHTGKYYTPTEPSTSGVSNANLAAEALTPIIAKLVANISQGLAGSGQRGVCGNEGNVRGGQPLIQTERGICGNEEGGDDGSNPGVEPGRPYHPPVHGVCGNDGDRSGGENPNDETPMPFHPVLRGACGNGHEMPVEPQMSADDAIDALMKDFSLLAKNGLVSIDTLKKAANGEIKGLPKSLQRAAQYLTSHDKAMGSLETAVGRRYNNAGAATKDGLISMDDLRLEKENRQMAVSHKPMTEAQAVAGLQHNFMLLRNPATGLISTSALLHAAKGQFSADASPAEKAQAQKSAQYFIDHPDALTALDTADGRRLGNSAWSKPDDLISIGDIAAHAGEIKKPATHHKKPAPPMTELDAIKALQQNMKLLADPATGLISTSSLLHAAKGLFARNATPEEKAKAKKAAQYFVDHPAQLTSLETAIGRKVGNHKWATPDDLISASDLATEAATLQGKTAKPKAAHKKQEPMTEESAIMALQDNYDLLADHASGMISTAGLMRAAKGQFSEDASPLEKDQAKRAAQYFLDHPAKLKSLDTANGHRIGDTRTSKADGRISRSDLLSEANSLPLSKADISILNTLLIHQPKDEPHWLLGRSQMEAILKDPAAPADLKDAITKLKNDPALYRRLDTANQVTNSRSAGNFGDGMISDRGLNALILRPEVAKSKQVSKERLAFALLSENRLFMTGGEDRLLSKGDLDNAFFGDGPFSILEALSENADISLLVKVSKAARFFRQDQQLFDKLNSSIKT